MINFETGNSLADFQQELFETKVLKGIPFEKDEIRRLKDNLWVKLASRLAPGNLVIRHYVLIDYSNYYYEYPDKILSLIKKLCRYTTESKHLLWAEGYSYWLYTKPFIEYYAYGHIPGTVFTPFSYFISVIDQGFADTAYYRNGILYPAPIGDLRDIPLEKHLQNHTPYTNVEIDTLYKYNQKYTIHGSPIGLNTHVSKDSYRIDTASGTPIDPDKGIPFKFYEGYNLKYKNKWRELLDTFSFKRIKSI